jgi:hypothetical protein
MWAVTSDYARHCHRHPPQWIWTTRSGAASATGPPTTVVSMIHAQYTSAAVATATLYVAADDIAYV